MSRRFPVPALLLVLAATAGCPAAPTGGTTPAPTRPRGSVAPKASPTPAASPSAAASAAVVTVIATPAPTPTPVPVVTPPPPEPGGQVTTLAGAPPEAGVADGPGAAARFREPEALALAPNADPPVLYVSDGLNHTIRKLVLGAGGTATVSTVLGQAGQPGTLDGVGTAARLNRPAGLSFDARGRLWIAEAGGHAVRRATFGADGAATLETVAGGGEGGFADGPGKAARFEEPSAVVVDGAGVAYVADRRASRVRTIDAAGVVTTLLGPGETTSADGPAATATTVNPFGLALGADGTLFVSEVGTQFVRKVAPAGVRAVRLLAGRFEGGWRDGFWDQVLFVYPSHLALDPKGRLVIADAANHRIRRLTLPGDVETVAGGGAIGKPGEGAYQDGAAADARFAAPRGVAVGRDGAIYVADTFNHAIRRIAPGP